ncbi:MAG: type II secretion system protein GspG [Oligoflexia bacterium]|nr:type II secretion system protein GspG [Oligoflexia bacterium]
MILLEIFNSKNKKYYKKGYTLIEVAMTMVLIGILSVAGISMLDDSLKEDRFGVTVKSLKEMRNALVGDPDLIEFGKRTHFGYLGDIGDVPTNAQGISALITNPGLPIWTINSVVRIAYGWNGPYLTVNNPGADYSKDAWNNNYVYSVDANGVTITSYGGDGVAGGTGLNQDISINAPLSLIWSQVNGFISDGAGPYTSGTATIEIYYPDGSGALKTVQKNIAPAANGYFSFSNIPLGVHSVKVFIPNATAPTKTLGPAIITVDRSNFVIPTNTFNINPP